MLVGFTLFLTSKGWQCSTKQAEQDGWSVKHIPEEHAQRILAQLSQDKGIETDRTREPNPTKVKQLRRVLIEE
jgi:hypothetical protein